MKDEYKLYAFAMDLRMTFFGGLAISRIHDWVCKNDRCYLDVLMHCLTVMKANDYASTFHPEGFSKNDMDIIEDFAAGYKSDIYDLIKAVMEERYDDAIQKVHKIWWEN